MKKKILGFAVLVLMMSILSGCCLSHEWQEATCETPKTCAKCEAVEGEALGHTWEAATCEAPETCSTCGKTQGTALNHAWQAATCEVPETCANCGTTQGNALGHCWVEATCETAKTCAICAATEGEIGGHLLAYGLITEDEATGEVTLTGTCITCGASDAKLVYTDQDTMAKEWICKKFLPFYMQYVQGGDIYNFFDSMSNDYFLFEEDGSLEMVFQGTQMTGSWIFSEVTTTDGVSMLTYVISTNQGILRIFANSPDVCSWMSDDLILRYAEEGSSLLGSAE